MNNITPKLEENQDISEISTTALNSELPEPAEVFERPKRERNLFVLSMGEKCVESRIQEILSINPKTWNNLKNLGVIPRTGTNGEFLTKIFKYYREQEGVAAAKVELNKELQASKGKFRNAETDSGLPKIVEAEKLQKIRLDRAREEEVHLKNLQTRSTLLDKQEMLELLTPLFGNIANVLRNAADDNPLLQPTIDKCFNSLFSTGQTICKQADVDSEQYVKAMLSREIDLDELLAGMELEI
jgi:hypothetical protein